MVKHFITGGNRQHCQTRKPAEMKPVTKHDCKDERNGSGKNHRISGRAFPLLAG